MKAIKTRHRGPTATQPSKIIATAEGGHRLSISLPDLQSQDDQHAMAAIQLCKKLKWQGDLIGGGLPDGDMCWVFASGTKYAIA